MLNMFCSILYNKVVFSGWIYTAALRLLRSCRTAGEISPFPLRWRRLIYRLLCRRTDLNTVSAKFCFQKRMNIKKYAVQRPYKYMWAVQLGRPHMFMHPLGRIFLYNLCLLATTNSMCFLYRFTPKFVPAVTGICDLSNLVAFSQKQLWRPMAANRLPCDSWMLWTLTSTSCGCLRRHTHETFLKL